MLLGMGFHLLEENLSEMVAVVLCFSTQGSWGHGDTSTSISLPVLDPDR